ncbi:flavin reductase family protein [Actinomadura barringtoniae]|uniref:Flavin reductase family protein n=1 Tax=Actinomadura barringtoniae TaxID=1427535 RepID=A0A939T570_9ACTN|nr:flavin reductase family protein [Actinomadura barringtoniae]MBO2450278.1 flavin reductase family protein [Actinomadura barringtoniae]
MTVITTATEDGFAGFTVNSFTSVSMNPPLVLFCAGNDSETAAEIEQSKSFAVNILSRGQEEVSRRFCDSDCDRFSGVEVASAATGAPILREALAYVDCELDDAVTAGDHRILVGRVRSAGRLCDEEPLAFFKGAYR